MVDHAKVTLTHAEASLSASAMPIPVPPMPRSISASPKIPAVPGVPVQMSATTPPKPSTEANPNANVPALPPEAVLSPTPPPALDGRGGVVFILDVSGSMYEPYAGATRLAFARAALAQQVSALKDGTPFAIILYALNATASGPLVAASDATREAAVRFLQRDVDCGGGTNLPAGLAAAQQLHAGQFVLVTDGDLNISSHDLLSKSRDILGEAGKCPALTVIGIAPRANTTADHLLRGLASQGAGAYSIEQANGEVPLLTSAAGAVAQPTATR